MNISSAKFYLLDRCLSECTVVPKHATHLLLDCFLGEVQPNHFIYATFHNFVFIRAHIVKASCSGTLLRNKMLNSELYFKTRSSDKWNELKTKFIIMFSLEYHNCCVFVTLE